MKGVNVRFLFAYWIVFLLDTKAEPSAYEVPTIRPIPCLNRMTGESGVCTFHWTCVNVAHGVHIGPCVDRFLIGSCCQFAKKTTTKTTFLSETDEEATENGHQMEASDPIHEWLAGETSEQEAEKAAAIVHIDHLNLVLQVDKLNLTVGTENNENKHQDTPKIAGNEKNDNPKVSEAVTAESVPTNTDEIFSNPLSALATDYEYRYFSTKVPNVIRRVSPELPLQYKIQSSINSNKSSPFIISIEHSFKSSSAEGGQLEIKNASEKFEVNEPIVSDQSIMNDQKYYATKEDIYSHPQPTDKRQDKNNPNLQISNDNSWSYKDQLKTGTYGSSYNQMKSTVENLIHGHQRPLFQNVLFGHRIPIEKLPTEQINTIAPYSTYNKQNPVGEEIVHDKRKTAVQNLSHDVQKFSVQNMLNFHQRPDAQNSSHDQGGPNVQNISHNQRNPILLNSSHNQRLPIVQDMTYDQRRPITQDSSHNLRKPVAPESSHVQRKPVAPEGSHDQRKPVAPESSHDQRKPVAPESSHDQRNPVVVEYLHDQRLPLIPDYLNEDLWSEIDYFLMNGGTADVNKDVFAKPDDSNDSIPTITYDDYTTLGTRAASTETTTTSYFTSQSSIDFENMNLQEQFNISNTSHNFENPFSWTTSSFKEPTYPWPSSTIANNFLGSVSYDLSKICGRSSSPMARIVGGRKSTYLRWPWMISLRRFEGKSLKHKCGATLLNELWAITAAHCVDGKSPTDVVLRLGEYNFYRVDESLPHEERRLYMIIMHPSFDPVTYENDLALLRFYNPIRLQANIVPVCLPHFNEDVAGRTAVVTGWGRLSEEGQLPASLHEVLMPILKNSECEAMYSEAGYSEKIRDVFVCAGLYSGGRDACEGDSGGPMVVRDDDGRWFLVGLISWGMGCAAPRQPGVYTRITKFVDWIESYISL